MNDKLNVGDQFTTEFQYSQAHVEAFMETTGDRNPIHHDADYASQTVFKRPIIHGFLSGAIFSKIFGTQFPGEGTIYLSQELKFMRPMYVDEPYKAVVEVIKVDREKHRCIMATQVFDRNGKATIGGQAVLMNPGAI